MTIRQLKASRSKWKPYSEYTVPKAMVRSRDILLVSKDKHGSRVEERIRWVTVLGKKNPVIFTLPPNPEEKESGNI